ncbi:MAG: TIGR03960 family B12-binding radical SAM protein [Lachnospiraceae bacterium]|nr:TIGR03960 family B12-binding radical SAM protein [Lachnospiraceae bacterium]
MDNNKVNIFSPELALPDEILSRIDKPERYIGHEVNMVVKDLSKIDVRFCMCFPDVYEVGMSHLGIQILYDMFNQREDTYCERVYSPWPDLDKIMREEHIPLFALESQQPIKNFDFLGITLQYEMCYTNILQVLELSGIPIFANERTMDDPIVIGGGPCSYNPEPLADYFDIFYIGEGETVYYEMIDVYKELKARGASRREILERLGNIEGLYIPSLYSVSYNENGTIAEFKPIANVPAKIKRQVVTNLSETFYPRKPLVPYMKAIQDRAVLEIQRGCIRGCRFCQAGMIYRPIRERSLEVLKENIIDILNSTGYDEITLSSLSTSDYTRLGELLEYLIAEMGDRKVNISLPSLRIDAFSLDIMNKVQDVKKSSLTFAPEGGTQRMRNVINKGLTEEQILEGAAEAFKGGWNKVKLYFMLGQPTETDEDVKGIPLLANEIAKTYYATVPKEQRQGKVAITISTSYFVPKPFTPFQWVGQIAPDEYLRRKSVLNETLKQQLNYKSIKYNWHDSATSYLEGLLARGDRRVGRVVYEAYKLGCIFDAWTDYFDASKWDKAIELAGIDIEFYTQRERSREEILPWDFIDTGISKKFLLHEWDKALEGVVTDNCRAGCAGCGCAWWQTGVCVEAKG